MTKLFMDSATAAEVKEDFGALRSTLSGGRSAVSGMVDDLATACGELAGETGAGRGTFEIGWREVLDVCGLSSSLVITNVNELSVELTVIDENATISLRPDGPP